MKELRTVPKRVEESGETDRVSTIQLPKTIESPAGAPPGLGYLPAFLAHDEEAALLAELEQLDWDGRGKFRRRCNVVKRREIDFIHDYGRNNRKLSPGPPLPPFLEPVRASHGKLLLLPVSSKHARPNRYGIGKVKIPVEVVLDTQWA